MLETAQNGKGANSSEYFYGDCSYFLAIGNPFFSRGDSWGSGGYAGLFAFYYDYGGAYYIDGFRAVLV